MARILEFTLQCKILENSDKPFSAETAQAVSEELNQALIDLRQRGESTVSRRPSLTPSRSKRNSESNGPVSAPVTSALTSRATSALDINIDTIVSRVMFVYFTNRVHYTKCNVEKEQYCSLQEMLRSATIKARRPAQLCRLFSCDTTWGNVKEVDLHETGQSALKSFPITRANRLNFIVDYVNTVPEENRPTPFDLNPSQTKPT